MKVALVGSAPSSVRLAPYNDPSWKIWACSPGSIAHVSRCDAFFELHRWEPGKPWFGVDYRMWMAQQRCPVYMIEPVAEIPSSVAYPKDEMIKRFGPFFFTSSLSWMFALAIHQGATEIALYGVDMSAQEEWEFQRSGCHYFIQRARELGITVTIPHESDLLSHPPLYGMRENDPMHIKLLKREEELTAQMKSAEGRMQEATGAFWFYKGALDDCRYMLKTWVSDPTANELARANPSPAQPEIPHLMAAEPNGHTGEPIIVSAKASLKYHGKAAKKKTAPAKKRGRPRKAKANGAAHVSQG